MYRPKPYILDDAALLRDLIRARGLATIAAAVDGAVELAYAPVVVDETPSPLGGVRFHLARGNPLASRAGAKLRLSFIGPDAYVSPDWYESAGLVPTWNYIAVEATGTAERLDGDALERLLVDLSTVNENRLLPKPPWTLDKVPVERLAALKSAIEGFVLCFETLEGKLKLSQEKADADFAGVVAALEASGKPAGLAVAAAMRRFVRQTD